MKIEGKVLLRTKTGGTKEAQIKGEITSVDMGSTTLVEAIFQLEFKGNHNSEGFRFHLTTTPNG